MGSCFILVLQCFRRDLRVSLSQYFGFLMPEAIIGMVFGTRNLKFWVLGPFGTARRLFILQQAEALHEKYRFLVETLKARWAPSKQRAQRVWFVRNSGGFDHG